MKARGVAITGFIDITVEARTIGEVRQWLSMCERFGVTDECEIDDGSLALVIKLGDEKAIIDILGRIASIPSEQRDARDDVIEDLNQTIPW